MKLAYLNNSELADFILQLGVKKSRTNIIKAFMLAMMGEFLSLLAILLH
jgi:hypothetical protein